MLLLENQYNIDNFFAQLVQMNLIEEKNANDLKNRLILEELNKKNKWVNAELSSENLAALSQIKADTESLAKWYADVIAKEATAVTTAQAKLEKNNEKNEGLNSKKQKLQSRYSLLFTLNNFLSVIAIAASMFTSVLFLVPVIGHLALLVVMAVLIVGLAISMFVNYIIDKNYNAKIEAVDADLDILAVENSELSKLISVNNLQNDLGIVDYAAELQLIIAALDKNIKTYEPQQPANEDSNADNNEVAVVAQPEAQTSAVSDTASAAVVATSGLFAVAANNAETTTKQSVVETVVEKNDTNEDPSLGQWVGM